MAGGLSRGEAVQGGAGAATDLGGAGEPVLSSATKEIERKEN